MIYTSFYGNAEELSKKGIEIVSVSRGKPKWFSGRSLDCLAPTWNMLKMNDQDYDREYEKILSRNNAKRIVDFLGNHNVALCCWEKNDKDCHRSKIAKWLRDNGYDVQEYKTIEQQIEEVVFEPEKDEYKQISLFEI